MNNATLEAPRAPAPLGGALEGKYLTFKLGLESYGISILPIREILQMPEVTPVPQVPSYVRGVLNLRGKIIPVIDLRRRLQLPHDAIDGQTCVVVVQVTPPGGQARQVGLVVDDVEEVVNIQGHEVEETPEFGSRLQSDYLLGMAKIKGKVKTLLDINQVFFANPLQDIGLAS